MIFENDKLPKQHPFIDLSRNTLCALKSRTRDFAISLSNMGYWIALLTSFPMMQNSCKSQVRWRSYSSRKSDPRLEEHSPLLEAGTPLSKVRRALFIYHLILHFDGGGLSLFLSSCIRFLSNRAKFFCFLLFSCVSVGSIILALSIVSLNFVAFNSSRNTCYNVLMSV